MTDRISRTFGSTFVGLVALGLLAAGVEGQTGQRTTWDGIFSEEQAGRGAAVYQSRCTACHGTQLEGVGEAPALIGGRFAANWNGILLSDMVNRIDQSMPIDAPGALSRRDVVDVLAYIMERNGFPPGQSELPSQSGYLRAILYSSYQTGSDGLHR